MGRSNTQSPQEATRRGRRWATALIVFVGLAAIASFAFLRLCSGSRLRIGACFQDVNGLRRGARVRLAGVDVGAVREIRAQPTDQTCPGAVEMELRHRLQIPDDSVASVETAGILGESFVEIDVTKASGPSVREGALLPSKESVKLNAETLNRALTKAVERINQRLDDDKNRKSESDKASPIAPSSKRAAAPAK